MKMVFKLVLVLLPIILANATNPSPKEYRRYVYRKLCLTQGLRSWDVQMTCDALNLLPETGREWALGKNVTRDNYWLFSVYTLDAPTLYDASLGLGGGFIDISERFNEPSQLAEE